jgi:TATA-box binding protein (TBP) (component of TFIID and TFIIIB)
MDTHSITELAAIIATDVADEEFPEGGCLLILVWRDRSMRVIFPSGSKIDTGAKPGMDFDAFIDIAIATIHRCRLDMGRLYPPQITVHNVPTSLTTEDQILAWIQSVPGIALEFGPPEGMGFGGPLPPPGQAG